MIKIRDILKEIGEGSAKPYNYTRSTKKGAIQYRFRTDSDINYVVNFNIFPQKSGVELYVDFLATDPTKNIKAKYTDETNKGEQFRVMATVVHAIKNELKKQPQITHIVFEASKSYERDDRRANFYKAYVEKQIPGAEVTTLLGGEYKISLPKK